jgi:ribosomal protein L29
MTRYIKRGGQIWIRIFPHTPVTRKPQDVKMGSGKGNPEFFVAKVKAGTIMFEMDGVAEGVAREAMRLAGHKLPVKTTFLVKEEAVMKIAEIRKLSTGDWLPKALKLREEITELAPPPIQRRNHKCPHSAHKRKDLARMLTVLSEQPYQGGQIMARTITGTVVSDKADKTIVINVLSAKRTRFTRSSTP